MVMINLNNVTEYLKDKYNLQNGFFCIYGSYATGTQNKRSDIDLLYIYRINNSKLKRTTEYYKSIPISFYELSIKDLYDDSKGKYGGFFCGKVFNPNVLINELDEDNLAIQKSIAIYFSNLFSKKYCLMDKNYNSDEILKNSICSYIELYPEYFSYIARLMNNKSFMNIWKRWKEAHINLLLNENVIKKRGNYYIYQKVYSKEEFEMIKIDYISRFWIYGAVSHNSNLNFYDYYKNKNLDYILEHKILKGKTEKFLGIKYRTRGDFK